MTKQQNPDLKRNGLFCTLREGVLSRPRMDILNKAFSPQVMLSLERRGKETMPTIRLETFIDASPKRCFDLSLNVDLHRHSVAHTSERPVAGVTSGVMKLGDTVTWEAV